MKKKKTKKDKLDFGATNGNVGYGRDSGGKIQIKGDGGTWWPILPIVGFESTNTGPRKPGVVYL